MSCKPRTYKEKPPFLNMRTRQRKGVRVNVAQVFNRTTGEEYFKTYKGYTDRDRAYGMLVRDGAEAGEDVELKGFDTYEVRNGAWENITRKQVPQYNTSDNTIDYNRLARYLAVYFNAKPNHQLSNVINNIYEAQLDNIVDNFEDAFNLARALFEEISRTIAGS